MSCLIKLKKILLRWNPYQGPENSNPPQPPNINKHIDEGLATLMSLLHELRCTREPSKLSLATSLDAIISSIANSQGKLTIIYEYRFRMLESFTGLE